MSEQSTPSSRWAQDGKPDPHGKQYDCERAKLAYGQYTDDEIANAVYLCDHRSDFRSIALLTGAKERIRWLSRSLEAQIADNTDLRNQNAELLAALHAARRFIAAEYYNPAAVLEGEWLSSTARPVHQIICNAIANAEEQIGE
jgi:hypothetical protein